MTAKIRLGLWWILFAPTAKAGRTTNINNIKIKNNNNKIKIKTSFWYLTKISEDKLSKVKNYILVKPNLSKLYIAKFKKIQPKTKAPMDQ